MPTSRPSVIIYGGTPEGRKTLLRDLARRVCKGEPPLKVATPGGGSKPMPINFRATSDEVRIRDCEEQIVTPQGLESRSLIEDIVDDAFPVGALVQLKSGGVVMTVTARSVDDCEVTWSGYHLLEQRMFPAAALKVAAADLDDEIPF